MILFVGMSTKFKKLFVGMSALQKPVSLVKDSLSLECLIICWDVLKFVGVSHSKNSKLLECLAEDFLHWDVLTDFIGVSCIVDSLLLGCLLRNSNSLECLAEDFMHWDVLTEFVGVSHVKDSLLLECLPICWDVLKFVGVSHSKNSKLLECLAEDFMRWDVLTDFVEVSCIVDSLLLGCLLRNSNSLESWQRFYVLG
jgi:hypothetical protein